MNPPVPVEFIAVILSGGRSSRLGGTPKAALQIDGLSLLELTNRAAAGARRVIVVGPDAPVDAGAAARTDGLAGALRSEVTSGANREFVRESPAFGGPAAALAAAVDHLAGDPTRWILVLACDMPRVAQAIPTLLAAAADQPDYSVMAHDGGRDQPLAALYRLDALRSAVADIHASGGVQNLSMKALLARVQWRAIDVQPGSTADVDTWADAQSLGVSGTAPT